jgi:hypothetical protein
VAERVIDDLETVEIEEQHGEPRRCRRFNRRDRVSRSFRFARVDHIICRIAVARGDAGGRNALFVAAPCLRGAELAADLIEPGAEDAPVRQPVRGS